MKLRHGGRGLMDQSFGGVPADTQAAWATLNVLLLYPVDWAVKKSTLNCSMQ